MNQRFEHAECQPTRVLVALDGSTAAQTALPIARRMARQLGIELCILHVAPTRVPEEVVRNRLALEAQEQQGEQIYLHLGEAAPGILEVASDPSTELVVLTTHGRRVEERHTLGGVAEAVISACRGPILVVRPESIAAESECGDGSVQTIQSMLLPLDGTPTTLSALGPATELARRLRARIDLLYVLNGKQPVPAELGSVNVPCYVDQPQHEWPHWCRTASDHLVAQLGCPTEVSVQMCFAVGEVGAEILRFASEHREDVIVLARRSRLEPQRAHVLRTVLDQAPCPVLVMGVPSAPAPSVGAGASHRLLAPLHTSGL